MAENRMRGQIKIDPSLDSRVGVAGSIGNVGSSGASEAFGALSREMTGISTAVGQLADRAAKHEGTMDGKRDGIDAAFRPTNQPTIYGQAYDDAGLQIAETRLRSEINNTFEEAYRKHGSNPAALKSVLDASQKGFVEQMQPELRARLGSELAISMRGGALTLMRRAAREQDQRIRAEQTAALDTSIADHMKQIHQRAYAAGMDIYADGVMAHELAGLSRTLSRRGVDGQPLVSPAQREKLMRQAKEEVVFSRMLGAFERASSLDDKSRMIADLEKQYGESRGLGGMLSHDKFRSLHSKLETALRQDRTEARTAYTALNKELDAVVKRAERGVMPADADLQRLQGAAARDPQLAAGLELATRQIEFARDMRSLPPRELDQWIQLEERRQRAKGATALEDKRLTFATGLAGNMKQALDTDPLGWAERVGWVRQVVPIDASTPEKLASSMTARIAQGDEIARISGRPARYLQPADAERITQAMAKGGAPMLQAAQLLAMAAGDRAGDVFTEVAQKGDAPTLAYFGKLVAGADVTKFAMDASDGIALRKAQGVKRVVKMPTADEENRMARSLHAGALDGNVPSVRAAIDLANAAYEVRAARSGHVEKIDEDLWKQAYREALGERRAGTLSFGGLGYSQPARTSNIFSTGPASYSLGPVIVPANVRTDGFKDLIDTIRLEDFGDARPYHRVPLELTMDDIKAGGVLKPRHEMKPASITDLRRAVLRTVDDGRYQIITRSDAAGVEVLVDKAGRPFELDLKALAPVLRKRRPDLYDGAR